jgi:copper chaperone CopZ
MNSGAYLALAMDHFSTSEVNRNYMKDITLAISGMSCGHCLNAVNQAINAVPDVVVKSVKIGRAELRVPDADPAGNEVKAAIERAGYKVEGLIAG